MTSTRSTRTRRTLIALAATLLLAACGDDESGSEDTLPAVSTTATATTIPVTAPPTTVAAATTTTSTTSTTSTSTTSTTLAATTTTEPFISELVLRETGLGDAIFGADAEEVIAYITSILGAPTADSGWADPFASFGPCPGTEVRGVTWDDLLVLFSDESPVASGRRHFFSYTYGPAFGLTIEPEGMYTEFGITVGDTVGRLLIAYPDAIVTPSDGIFDANFYVSDNLMGFLSGPAETDTIRSITGGTSCGG